MSDIQVLGSSRIIHPEGKVLFLERKQAAIVTLLALRNNMSRHDLARLLWPDSPEHTARNNLVHRIRKLHQLCGETVVIGADMLTLQHPEQVDAVRLLKGTLELQHDHLHIYSQPLLDGINFDDLEDFSLWLDSARERVEFSFSQQVNELVHRYESNGEITQAILALKELQARFPYNEDHHRRLMQLYYLHGDRTQALKCFEKYCHLIKKTLGLEPDETLVRMAEWIRKRHHDGIVGQYQAYTRSILVGRERELLDLSQNWKKGQWVMLRGPTGSGKTRVLQEFRKKHPQALMLSAGMGTETDFELLRFAFVQQLINATLHQAEAAQWHDLTRQCHQVLRCLEQVVLQTPDADLDLLQGQMLELLRQVHAHHLGFLVDDAHLMDEGSLHLLHLLHLKCTTGERFPLVLALNRQDPANPGHSCAGAFKGQDMMLGSLSDFDFNRLLRNHGFFVSAEFSGFLYRHFRGLPGPLLDFMQHTGAAHEHDLLKALVADCMAGLQPDELHLLTTLSILKNQKDTLLYLSSQSTDQRQSASWYRLDHLGLVHDFQFTSVALKSAVQDLLPPQRRDTLYHEVISVLIRAGLPLDHLHIYIQDLRGSEGLLARLKTDRMVALQTQDHRWLNTLTTLIRHFAPHSPHTLAPAG